VLFILVAYGLLSAGIIASTSAWYHGLNLIGGIGIIVDALSDKNYQPAVLNVIWIMIALYGLSQVFI